MRLVFAGTPAFSVAALDALVGAGHRIVGVYTQPDRPAGRGRKLGASPVALRAEQLDLPVFKPATLRGNNAALDTLRDLKPECMVVVAYGLILPQPVLDIPLHGCLNIHASLLPRWRGAAPIQRAVLAGDDETGVTIMRMEAGLDTGPMLLRQAVAVAPHMTSGDLHDVLAPIGARLIVEALDALARGTLREEAQPAQGASYAHKLATDEARLDWSMPAAELLRRIHGYNPMPGAWCEFNGERLKLLRAEWAGGTPPSGGAAPGTVIAGDDTGLSVMTGNGVLRLTELQRPGSRPAKAALAFGGRAPIGRTLA